MIYIVIILLSVLMLAVYRKLQPNTACLRSVRRDAFPVAYLYAAVMFLAIVFLMAFFSCYRGFDVGTDTYNIYYLYFYLPYCVNGATYSGTEIGFYLIIKLGYLLFHSYTGVLFTIALPTIVFALLGITYFKDRINIVLSLLIYLSFIYFTSFNTMRQYLAVSIIFFSLRFIDRKQYIRFIITFALAVTIHNSSLICGVILLFKIFENKNKLLVILFFAIVIGCIFLPKVVGYIVKTIGYGSYNDRDYVNEINFELSISNLSIIILYSPAFLITLYFRKRLIAKDHRNKVLLLMVLMSFICATFKLYMVWLSRLMFYFSIALCLVLPQCVDLCQTKAGSFGLKIILVLYSFSFFILNYIILGNGAIYPYSFNI